ncbi:hypothetical protein [Xanthobacter sp. 91]|uniref:hypothetical protein n=1 Tax=Xanthobacter sp. 91 TaxID=1117244 RepID=UPI000494F98E|nr:hypothetical protein [Xanthobacter sp. 91]
MVVDGGGNILVRITPDTMITPTSTRSGRVLAGVGGGKARAQWNGIRPWPRCDVISYGQSLTAAQHHRARHHDPLDYAYRFIGGAA